MVEGTALKLVISVLIIALVLPISIYEISVFNYYQNLQKVFLDINEFENKIEFMINNYEVNSYDNLKLRIPYSFMLSISNNTNKLTLFENSGVRYENELPARIIQGLNISEGDYVIELYYGRPHVFKNYSVVFE